MKFTSDCADETTCRETVANVRNRSLSRITTGVFKSVEAVGLSGWVSVSDSGAWNRQERNKISLRAIQ